MDAPEFTTKRCSRGDQCVHPQGPYLPATVEFFYHNMYSGDGLRAECRACNHKMTGFVPKIKHDVPPAGYKRCLSEGECLTPGGPILAIEYFSKNRNRPDGLNSRCKPCTRAQNKDWSNRHPGRAYEYSKKAKKRHPEKGKGRHHRRKAKLLDLPATFTHTDWLYALDWWHNVCAYCGHGPSMFDYVWVLHEEHYIPVARGGAYTPTNILPACQNCNLDKSDKDAHGWLIERFGRKKAKVIEARISAYFLTVRADPPSDLKPHRTRDERIEQGQRRAAQIAHEKSQKRRAEIAAHPPATKHCSNGNRCVHPQGPVLPFSSEYFNHDAGSVDGFALICRECNKAAMRDNYRKKHPIDANSLLGIIYAYIDLHPECVKLKSKQLALLATGDANNWKSAHGAQVNWNRRNA